MRYDAKRKKQLTSCQSAEDSALGEWGQELAKTIASTIAAMATLATNTRPVALGTVAETRPSQANVKVRRPHSVSLGRRQVLVTNKNVVRNERHVRQGAGHGVNATVAVTAIAAQVLHARSEISKPKK